MKRVLRNAVMAMLVMVLCVSTLAPAAQAATSDALPVNGTITATIHSENLPPEGDTVTVVLTALDGAPMPKGASGSVYENAVKCTGEDTEVVFNIPYEKLGVYHYTVSLVGSENDKYLGYQGTYDERVYDVTVSVVNNIVGGSYDGYITHTAAHLDGVKEKPEIEFENSYLSSTELTVVKKWVGGVGSASVRIALLCDGTEYKTVTLQESNDWQYKWVNLNPLHEWRVKEVKVPSAYTASYRYNETTGVWTVTNTTSLLQTGQLNWPIPVLAIAGVSIMAMGLYLMFARKKEKDA